MRENPDEAPLAVDCPSMVDRLRTVLGAARFDQHGIPEILGVNDSAQPRVNARDYPRIMERTKGDSSLHTLIRLLVMGRPVDLDAARRAIQPMTVKEWEELGLVETCGDQLHPKLLIRLAENLLVASDLSSRSQEFNCVLGYNGTAARLARFTIRRPVGKTLDLAAGSGFQGLLASAHSVEVVCADLNARAINFARFNAQLNGLQNMRFAIGSLFEPVEESDFDLIVCNPPFVITPGVEIMYRDGGRKLDQFSQQVVREVPSRLAEGGFAQVLCNWVHIRGEDWRQRVTGWLEGSNCDVWINRTTHVSVEDYALHWIADTEAALVTDDSWMKYQAWLEYYARHGVEAISYGLITMRKSTGRQNWLDLTDIPKVNGPCGEELLRGFALRDFLQAVRDDERLLDSRLSLAPETRWEQQLRPIDQGWDIISAHLRLARNMEYVGTIDQFGFALVSHCRGSQTLREVIAEMAAALEQPASELAEAALPVVRELIAQGFLLPAGMEEKM